MQRGIRTVKWLTDSDKSHAVLKILNQMKSDLVGSKIDSSSWQRHSSLDSVYLVSTKVQRNKTTHCDRNLKRIFPIALISRRRKTERIKNAINNAVPACLELTNDTGAQKIATYIEMNIEIKIHSHSYIVRCYASGVRKRLSRAVHCV